MTPGSGWGSDASPEVEQIVAGCAALERAGRWNEAYTASGDLLQAAARREDPLLLVHALYIAARSLDLGGHHETAEEIAGAALEMTRANRMTWAQARVLNLLGVILHKQEDWLGARERYEDALELAHAERDDELIGALCQNLGAVANAMGDLREARTLYLEGICSCVRSNGALTTASIYNNLGIVCSDLEEWMEAEIHFLRGIEIAERFADKPMLAALAVNRAEPLIRTGEFAEARASLRRAEEIVQEIGSPRVLADLHRFQGMSARLEGRHEEAEEHLERALDITRQTELALKRAETLEEIARLRWAQGRHGAARMTLREARRTFESIGADRDVRRADELAAQWRQDQGPAE